MDIQQRGPKNIYHARYINERGRRVSRSTKTANESKARAIAARWAVEAEDLRLGLKSPELKRAEKNERVPLDEHIKSYGEHQRNVAFAPRHITQVQAALKFFCDLTRACRVRDLTHANLDALIKCKREEKCNIRTRNAYISTLKAFSAWIKKSGRGNRDALVDYEKIRNESADTTHPRRPLCDYELDYLIKHTSAREVKDNGWMTPKRRAGLYLLAACTGLRANELCSLTRSDFELAGAVPYLKLAGRSSKNKDAALQPIAPGVAEVMRPLLEDVVVGEKVFKGAGSKTAKLLKADMTAARDAWLLGADDVERQSMGAWFLKWENDQGEFADFHALRHCYGTRSAASGAPQHVVQKLMRHSKPELTANIYSHANMVELAKWSPGLPVGALRSPATQVDGEVIAKPGV